MQVLRGCAYLVSTQSRFLGLSIGLLVHLNSFRIAFPSVPRGQETTSRVAMARGRVAQGGSLFEGRPDGPGATPDWLAACGRTPEGLARLRTGVPPPHRPKPAPMEAAEKARDRGGGGGAPRSVI